jgi:hypothetical protein
LLTWPDLVDAVGLVGAADGAGAADGVDGAVVAVVAAGGRPCCGAAGDEDADGDADDAEDAEGGAPAVSFASGSSPSPWSAAPSGGGSSEDVTAWTASSQAICGPLLSRTSPRFWLRRSSFCFARSLRSVSR